MRHCSNAHLQKAHLRTRRWCKYPRSPELAAHATHTVHVHSTHTPPAPASCWQSTPPQQPPNAGRHIPRERKRHRTTMLQGLSLMAWIKSYSSKTQTHTHLQQLLNVSRQAVRPRGCHCGCAVCDGQVRHAQPCKRRHSAPALCPGSPPALEQPALVQAQHHTCAAQWQRWSSLLWFSRSTTPAQHSSG